MDPRKELILDTIIQEHLKTGQPVGSLGLVEKYQLNVSPATVRNDMAFLEEEGYIAQPHTSAGRIPTPKAYRHYLSGLKAKKASKTDIEGIDETLAQKEEKNYKDMAKKVSQLLGTAVFWAPHKNNLFYTGISNLIQQPEFSQINLIYDISTIIDRIDEILDEEYNKFNHGVNILIGEENPFSPHCSAIILKYQHKEHDGIFGLLGPIRMDYSRNIGIVQFLETKLKN
jgi:heat-inducible transcriptional repressor